MAIDVRLKPERLKELREKFSTYSLGREINSDTAHKLLKEGNANINVRTLYKLCKLMDWPFPDYFEVIER